MIKLRVANPDDYDLYLGWKLISEEGYQNIKQMEKLEKERR